MFTPIDFNTWPRREMFYYFSKMAPTGYSLTVNLDVTHLRKIVKEERLKFFPAYLWLVTRCLNEQPEFKCAIKDGQLGYFDTLTPLYATMHPETRTISTAGVPLIRPRLRSATFPRGGGKVLVR